MNETVGMSIDILNPPKVMHNKDIFLKSKYNNVNT